MKAVHAWIIAIVAIIVVGGIVATIAFLMFFSTAFRRANSAALRVRCANNLKQIGLATAIYASKSNDSLPISSGPFQGTWLSDLGKDQADALAANMRDPSPDPRTDFYCPENATQSTALWDAAPTSRTIGYIWFGQRTSPPPANMPALPPSSTPYGVSYHSHYINTMYANQQVLAADWLLSDSSTAATAKWTDIPRLGSGNLGTSHLDGKTPAGANVLYFDNRVEWLKFTPAVPGKSLAIQQGGGPTAPYFWVPKQ